MIYLDNAATSFPKPEAVYRMLDHYLREVGANPGRSGHRRAVEAERLIGEARRALASLLGVSDPDRIIFGHNATDGLNIALKGFLRPGDHVVTSDLEHNSITRPLTGLEKKGWITVSRTVVPRGPRTFVTRSVSVDDVMTR